MAGMGLRGAQGRRQRRARKSRRVLPAAVRLTLAAACAAACLTPAAAGNVAPEPLRVGEHIYPPPIETPHPYPASGQGRPRVVWSEQIRRPDAAYLVLEFRRLELAPGDRLELRDEEGVLRATYRGRGPRGAGGGFITPMIPGVEVRLELVSVQRTTAAYGVRIERVTRGIPELVDEAQLLIPAPEAICGVDDQLDAVCYAGSHPQVYAGARPVARVLMDGVSLCTAWVVSCENHLITANHCTWSGSSLDTQEEVDRMEFQFLYEDATCGGDDAVVATSFLGGTFIENDVGLDYALLQAPAGEDPAADYGWLALDDRLPAVDDLIYIAGHPGGRPKEISLHSTDPADQDNPEGVCEIASLDEPPCVTGGVGEIGYYCDTDGGGSGSPVISMNSGRALALHHCPDCPNRGVPAAAIWQHNQAGAHPLPACAVFSAAGSVRLDRGLYGCSDVVAITVADASLTGAGSAQVAVSSDSESGPEWVTLTEAAGAGGTFHGSLPTAATAPVAGDGVLSVAHGETVLVRYTDAEDGQGGQDIPRQASAQVACSGPSIGQVAAGQVLGSSAVITWQTDRPADSTVTYTAAPPVWSQEEVASLVTQHQVRLTGLAACSDYLYQVGSRDEAGNLAVDDHGGQFHRFTTGQDVVLVPSATDTPQPVSDRQSTFSVIQVAEDQPLVDVNVTVTVDHTYTGDVELELTGPDGTRVVLSRDNGGDGDDYGGTVFDDEAPLSVLQGSAPFAGSYRPQEPLAAFDGRSAAGTWVLRVFDDEIGDTGTLQGWSLNLTLPALECGPHASLDGMPALADDCPVGGPADGDGVPDAGETLTLPLVVASDGTEPLTNVVAVVSALTPGVTVGSGSAVFGGLAAGAVSPPAPGLWAHLPDNIACGQPVAFLVELASDQGAWSEALILQAGTTLPAAGVVLDEDFDLLGIPTDWTVVDGGATAATWFTDSPDDPAGCASVNPRDPAGGMWAAVDSDCAGEVAMDEALLAPALDLSPAAAVTLQFDHYFRRDAGETAAVDVRSARTGGAWINVATWSATTANPEHVALDLTATAAGAADVEIRWHYAGANFAWYWYVDNVQVSFTAPGGCIMETCPTGSPPAEQGGVAWSSAALLGWDEDPLAATGYRLHRGDAGSLPLLAGAAVDSCLRAALPGPSPATADLAGDQPAPGRVLWYLVTGVNAVGEGSAGAGSAWPRIVNSSGDCPP